MNDWIYNHNDYSSQHLSDLYREAEQDRLASQLPRKPGLLETALNRLATVIQSI